MGVRSVGLVVGHSTKVLKDYVRRLAAELSGFLLDVWHGSVHWGWFTVLFLGTLAMASVGEFGGGLLVSSLAVISLGSNYWHYARSKGGSWRLTNFAVGPAILVVSVLFFFEINDIRGKSPWSHIPHAWNAMLLTSTIRTGKMSRLPPHPGLPDPFPEQGEFTPTIIASPKMPDKNSRFPLHAFPKGVIGKREIGDVVTLTLSLKNVADHIVDQESVYLYWYAPRRDDPIEEAKFEEFLWNKMPSTDVGEFPTNISESGNSLIKLETPPLAEYESTNLKKGIFVLFFMAKIREPRTKKTLAEFCGYLLTDNSIASCRRHNLP
jgi:hypothetical protein